MSHHTDVLGINMWLSFILGKDSVEQSDRSGALTSKMLPDYDRINDTSLNGICKTGKVRGLRQTQFHKKQINLGVAIGENPFFVGLEPLS